MSPPVIFCFTFGDEVGALFAHEARGGPVKRAEGSSVRARAPPPLAARGLRGTPCALLHSRCKRTRAESISEHARQSRPLAVPLSRSNGCISCSGPHRRIGGFRPPDERLARNSGRAGHSCPQAFAYTHDTVVGAALILGPRWRSLIAFGIHIATAAFEQAARTNERRLPGQWYRARTKEHRL